MRWWSYSEGELAMYVVGGVVPQIWNYSGHPGLPTHCFGATDYFVERVDVVEPAQEFRAPPPP